MESNRRPTLVIVSGRPGSGKSTLARWLAPLAVPLSLPAPSLQVAKADGYDPELDASVRFIASGESAAR